MPFTQRCASEHMHIEWQCTSTKKLVHGKKILSAIRYKLLDLVGKTMGKHYSKSDPRFCESCITKVQEIYPELSTKSETTDAEPMPQTDCLAEPPVKRERIDIEHLSEEERAALAQDLA